MARYGVQEMLRGGFRLPPIDPLRVDDEPDPFPLRFRPRYFGPGYPVSPEDFEAKLAQWPDPRTLVEGKPMVPTVDPRMKGPLQVPGGTPPPIAPQWPGILGEGLPEAPKPAGAGFDLEAALQGLGGPPQLPKVERPAPSKYGVFPEILAGLGDVFAAKAGRQGGHLARVQGMGEAGREREYQDRLTSANREYAGKKGAFDFGLSKLGMRKGAADVSAVRELEAGRYSAGVKEREAARTEEQKRYETREGREKEKFELEKKMLGGETPEALEKLEGKGFEGVKDADVHRSQRIAQVLGSDLPASQKEMMLGVIDRAYAAHKTLGPGVSKARTEAMLNPPPAGELGFQKQLAQELERGLKERGAGGTKFSPEALADLRAQIEEELYGTLGYEPQLYESPANRAMYRSMRRPTVGPPVTIPGRDWP